MIEHLAEKHVDRGHQFEIQDRLDEAIEAYERAVALGPKALDAYLALGRVRASRGQFDVALDLLDTAAERAIGGDPADIGEIREWRAYVLGRLRRYEEAIDEYFVVLDEGDPAVRVNLGRMLLAAARYDEAEEVLRPSVDPSGRQLYEALPRYREFIGEPLDDMRTTRYLFGATLLMGTAGDGGLRPGAHRYLLLTVRHVGLCLRRLVRLVDMLDWPLDGVVGSGPHHGPVAHAAARLLEVPVMSAADVRAGQTVLLANAVVKGSNEALAARAPLRAKGARVMHMAIGLIPSGDPDHDEPALVGFAGGCAVEWHRVEPISRLTPNEDITDGPYPGYEIGPAFIDPNTERVVEGLVEAAQPETFDPLTEAVLAWYTRHTQTRAHAWLTEAEADV